MMFKMEEKRSKTKQIKREFKIDIFPHFVRLICE